MLQVTEIGYPLADGAGSSILIAIAGILGTLLGTALGVFVTWRIQKRQLEHEDETRFHDRRLSIYADFNYACNALIASLGTNSSTTEDMGTFLRTWETLRLIASPRVVVAATPVHTDVMNGMLGQVSDLQSFREKFNQDMVGLLNAIREEIGVGKISQGTAPPL
jgi:hypothetical protein